MQGVGTAVSRSRKFDDIAVEFGFQLLRPYRRHRERSRFSEVKDLAWAITISPATETPLAITPPTPTAKA